MSDTAVIGTIETLCEVVDVHGNVMVGNLPRENAEAYVRWANGHSPRHGPFTVGKLVTVRARALTARELARHHAERTP